MKLKMEWIRRWRYRDLLVFCLFVLAGLAIYENSLGNPFHYDDQLSVEDNRNIRTIGNIPGFFTDPGTMTADPSKAGHYRPLVVTSYAINYAIGGLNPVAYHITNLVFHVGSAFLVFLIMRAMLRGMDQVVLAAPAAGLIFLVHPFNSEAVNYITARSSVMSGFFYLLGFYCWVRFREGKPLTSIFYLTSLLAFVAGMLSKEVVITLPIVLWLYDLYFGERRRTLLNWRTYIHYLPFVFIVVIPYIVLWVSSFGGVLPQFNRSIWTQIFTALPVLILHWKMFLMPLHLTPVHYVEVYKTFWSFSVIHSTLMLIIYVAIAILLYRILSRPCRLVSFFMLWFLIVLSPTTIVPLNAIFQENRGYLAVVSFVIPAGVIMGELWNTRIKKLVLAGLVLITIFYSAEVVQRNMVWRDDITLWSDAAKKAPEIPITYSSLGSAYRKAGMYDQAIGAYKKAQAVGGPAYYAARYNLAQVYIAQERWNLAALELEKVKEALLDNSQSRDRDDLVTVYNDLEMVYGKSGQSELAEKISKEAQWRLEKVP